MGDKLRMSGREDEPEGQAEGEDEIPRSMDQGQAFALLVKAHVALAASMDTFALIAERWAMKQGLLTKEDLDG